jgi:hypothetical protein
LELDASTPSQFVGGIRDANGLVHLLTSLWRRSSGFVECSRTPVIGWKTEVGKNLFTGIVQQGGGFVETRSESGGPDLQAELLST